MEVSSRLVEILIASDPARRDQPFHAACADLDVTGLLAESRALDRFRRASSNLYERVRALFFLHAVHRFELPARDDFPRCGHVPFTGWQHLLERRFEAALAAFSAAQESDGPSDAISSARAAAYHGLGFQTLADQVRRSVRAARGNQWMFEIAEPSQHPLAVRPELSSPGAEGGPRPILRERTPVRMDLTHSGWSDIFFLGMDYPEGARVVNTSVDLAVRGRDPRPEPPIEASFRLIDEPLLRLVSVDLGQVAEVHELDVMFDFARDYLGLLKAAVIAAGLVPPSLEKSGASLRDLLARVAGAGRGIEIVSHVRDIPKGSRLAVSTNLLASLIAVCMRATGQTASLEGPLREDERRLVASRAILGEWLGGSGGGWQDSGGLWPGIKLIRGQVATAGDPEFGISRGRLLPAHETLGREACPAAARAELQQSLVLVHGGMAQNVGPILEMVTEKYLLRAEPEWTARQEAVANLDRILAALAASDLARVAELTSRNFEGPIQTIIPQATNLFTETVIERVRARFGAGYRGFSMLGGMAGGGMGFFLDPALGEEAHDGVAEILLATKREYEEALPFAMDPVVYDFAVNESGSTCAMLEGGTARMPAPYDELVRPQPRPSPPPPHGAPRARDPELDALLEAAGFDPFLHERVRHDLLAARIGLAQNRLPPSTEFEDADEDDVVATAPDTGSLEAGRDAITAGEACVVTLAAGAASRWTQGAGVVKALHPFCRLGGKHRSFLETHLAKSRRIARRCGTTLPHVFTTSLFTHGPVERHLARVADYGYEGMLRLSPGRAVGLRLVPMVRDLRFLWQETAQQVLDQQAQKVRESLQAALIGWAETTGEASDYTDNVPLQCLHPVGHWFEIPNLLLNGVLLELLHARPQLRWLMLHNIDTVGADLDPARLGLHIARGAALSFEVVPRRIDDIGGGLARVDGRRRLVEGLAMPSEEAEFRLTYYNTGTTWIDLDQLLHVFGLTRAALAVEARVRAAVQRLQDRMPTYVTIKEVKKRWGHGQEDVYPVAQFEKLWGDMTTLEELRVDYHVVPRQRGQQLKDPAQLDGWLRDGSAAYVESLAEW